METRLITAEDAQEYHALWIRAVTEFPLAFLMEPAEVAAVTDDQLLNMIAAGRLMGVFHNGLIGFAGIGQRPLVRTRHRATLGPFFVMSECHGTGAADALMQGCLSLARSKGAWMVELYVAADNPRAIRFYERHGFQYEGRMPAATVVDGVVYDDFYYCLELPH